MTITYEWRGDFDNVAINALHAEGFNHPTLDADWLTRVQCHSLGWVCAREDGALVGFVNVVWDGDAHAFILDTAVAGGRRPTVVLLRRLWVHTDTGRSRRALLIFNA